MGDISEIRGLVLVVTFLGVLFLLLSWFPSELYSSEIEREVSTPDLFDQIDVWSFAETNDGLASQRLNESGGTPYSHYYAVYDTDLGNRDLNFFYAKANESTLDLYLEYKWYEWLIIRYEDKLLWRSRVGADRGDILTVAEMELDKDPSNNSTTTLVRYNAEQEERDFRYFVSFGYNNTVYSSFTNAWNYHGLYCFIAVDFDQVDTSYNAFAVIGMLLFFQMPDMNPVVNGIIAIPLWITMAYLIFILILRTIGAIFGGGA